MVTMEEKEVFNNFMNCPFKDNKKDIKLYLNNEKTLYFHCNKHEEYGKVFFLEFEYSIILKEIIERYTFNEVENIFYNNDKIRFDNKEYSILSIEYI